MFMLSVECVTSAVWVILQIGYTQQKQFIESVKLEFPQVGSFICTRSRLCTLSEHYRQIGNPGWNSTRSLQ